MAGFKFTPPRLCRPASQPVTVAATRQGRTGQGRAGLAGFIVRMLAPRPTNRPYLAGRVEGRGWGHRWWWWWAAGLVLRDPDLLDPHA